MEAADWVFVTAMAIAAAVFIAIWSAVRTDSRRREDARLADWAVVQHRGVGHLPLWALACVAAGGLWTWATLTGHEPWRVWIAVAFAVVSIVVVVLVVMSNAKAAEQVRKA